MKRGVWHQFGHNSQKMAEEQLQAGLGVGVIISPRDLTLDNATDYSASYKTLGASVLVDEQFYVPDFRNKRTETFPTERFRLAVSQLGRLTDAELRALSAAILDINFRVGADAVLAPALPYEPGRSDIDLLNRRLFSAAKRAGDALSVPTYSTAIVGVAGLANSAVLGRILDEVTTLPADGWYFAVEFDEERVPTSKDKVLRCFEAGLKLACTGKPVLHAFAGPMALLSFGFGSTGTAIGHSQNLWQFTRSRWEPPLQQGGGGDAPPRFFSTALWGTVVYPDELTLLPAAIVNQVTTATAFSTAVTTGAAWDRWTANKHLINAIGSTVSTLSSQPPRTSAANAVQMLDRAVGLHASIAAYGIRLADGTNSYQANWRDAVLDSLTGRSADFDYLDLLT